MTRPPSLNLITEAVVAEYIHEISQRHRVSGSETTPPHEMRPATAPSPEDEHVLSAPFAA
jgi:hypothetical protein